MNDPFSRNIRFNSSGLGCFLTSILIATLLTSVGLGWLVNGVIILIVMIPVTIVLGVFCFQWWLKRSLIEDACPACTITFTGLNNSIARCPNCGEIVQIENRSFQRQTPVGTVDVAVGDEESDCSEVKVVDVQVLGPVED